MQALGRTPTGLHRTGARLLRWVTAAVTGMAPGSAPVHEQVAGAWRLSGESAIEQFQRLLLSRLRVVFETAAGAVEQWSKAASTQIDQQLRERRQAFAHRHEALQRIQSAAGELEQRIAEVEQQDKRLAGAQWRLDALVEQALAAAHAAPPAREDADELPLRSQAS